MAEIISTPRTRPKRRRRFVRAGDNIGAAWRALRQPWVDYFARGGQMPCWKCSRIISQGSAWVLGHTTPASQGGRAEDSLPECRRCSDAEGGQLGHAAERANRAANSNGIRWGL